MVAHLRVTPDRLYGQVAGSPELPWLHSVPWLHSMPYGVAVHGPGTPCRVVSAPINRSDFGEVADISRTDSRDAPLSNVRLAVIDKAGGRMKLEPICPEQVNRG